MIFWTLIFPIVLGSLFNLAFSNLTENEKFDPVSIGVVNDAAYKGEGQFGKVIKELSKDNDDRVFKTRYYSNSKDAAKSLKDGKITGYYKINDEGKVKAVAAENGLEATIMKQIADSYYQTYAIAGTLTKAAPEAMARGIMKDVNEQGDYFVNTASKDMDVTAIYFYTLIAMACMYGGMFGIEAVKDSEANLSTIAARNSVAPTHKLKNLMGSLAAGYLIQCVEILILIAFLVFVLGIAFGHQLGHIVLLAMVGTLAGVSFGTMLGSCNRCSENAKVGILISVTMLCCVLGGMMSVDLRYIIKNSVPLLDIVNPISMITDGLYSLYCYSDYEIYTGSVIRLLVFSAVMVAISYFFVRRKKYDSI